MKIFKNKASITLTLEEFLGLLEEDALDDILMLLEDLDETGSIKGDRDGNYDNDYWASMDALIDDEWWYTDEEDEELWASLEKELAAIFGGMNTIVKDGSEEDKKVQKIVERFRYIEDMKP